MGTNFSDNPKYLFLYVYNNKKNIDLIWISKNKKVIDIMNKQDLPAYYLYSLKGVLSCLRAKVIFTSHGKHDISPTLTGGSIHVELCHFIMALKKLRYDVFNYYSFFQKLRFRLENPFIYYKPNYSISSSLFASSIIKSSLSLSKEKVFITGFPRTDIIMCKRKEDNENIKKVIGEQNYTHLIYFTPTWRDKILDFDYFSFELDNNNLVDFLEKTDSILILRFHPTDTMRREGISTSNPRIIFENHGLPDAFSLLKQSSVLITDYSGIYFDYLLIDRPIIFANFDHQSYLNNRELYWDYDDITPGPKAQNWPMLLGHLERVLIYNEDSYRLERHRLRDKVYKYKDNNSRARIIKEMSQVLDL